MLTLRTFGWILCLGLSAIPAGAQVFVVDEVGILSPAEIQSLGQSLEAYEAETGNEIAIRVVDSLDLSQKTIREYSYALFQALGIGKKGIDNGILIMLAPKNRRVAIELGYGIEPFISDLMAKAYIEEEMGPLLKAKQFHAAFEKVIQSIRRDLQNSYVQNPKRDSLVLDEASLLRSDQRRRLSQKIQKYQEKTGHSLWVRILNDRDDEVVSHRLAQIIFRSLEDPEDKVYQTLVFIGVVDKEDLKFNYRIVHNWPDLARQQIDTEDKEVSEFYKDRAQDKICQKLQIEVLDHSFIREKYYPGLKATVDLLEKVQNKETSYSKMKSPSYFLREYGLYILGGIAGGGVLFVFFYFGDYTGNKGGKGPGGKGYNASSYKSWGSGASSTGNSFGGGSSSSSGGGSYGGGSFGGGSSGGGGADGGY